MQGISFLTIRQQPNYSRKAASFFPPLILSETFLPVAQDYAQQLDTNAARARDTLFGVFGELLTETMDDLDDAGAGREDQADGGADSGSVDDEVTSAILEGLDLAFRQSYITLAQKLFLQQLAERYVPSGMAILWSCVWRRCMQRRRLAYSIKHVVSLIRARYATSPRDTSSHVQGLLLM